ncbi:SusD family protein [Bacteroides pyogenes F0041]|uniref:SusD family protein n=1 Tax=Bacteroides pyogenes F0041 TaxID=1321819 RepID=U2BUJ2_9BACE|nr:RagB/SusD family nutrient uptake outer membrane protein [Bacteroides pyogenes]ERI81849.1 SusD family protein [Bacteroides pyogenes F0041]MBB3894490.1 hypothetical protein [Bacteroides pyogenes]SUV32373.1 putative lipoprotein [Bacteroides pyogenes]
MKVKYILAVASITCAVAACDVLDIAPLDTLTDKSYWTTVNDLKLYANGFYNNLDAPSVNKDDVSDNCVTTNYAPILFNESTVPASGGGWDWENIRACNFFMKRYHTVQGTPESINPYVAEIRFFRALDYYGKIKSFGDVPWYESDLTDNDKEELYKPREPRDEILLKVIDDMRFAIQWLPEAGMQEKGRLHKDAARAQLARICLYYGTYKKYHKETGKPTSEELLKEAILQTDELIKSGRYAIVKGSDAGCGQLPFEGYPLHYSNQFVQEDLSSNKEAIFARYYVQDLLTHQTGRRAGSSGTGLSKDFIESFLCKDGKPIANTSLYKGDESLEDEFVNRDPRMYQIVDNKNKPYLIINGEKQTNPYPDCAPSNAVTGYPCVKFRSPLQIQWEANKTTYDWFVYRYAETLLINAEAKYELGQCTQDVLNKTINLLRDRVGMPHLTTAPEADKKPLNYGYEVEPLLYEIRRERRIELVAEGHRWDDLRRWNAMKLLENPKTMLGIRVTDKVKAQYGSNVTFGGETGRPLVEYEGKTYLHQYTGKELNDAGRKWSENDKRWLSPIPTDQLTLYEGVLKQNPNW